MVARVVVVVVISIKECGVNNNRILFSVGVASSHEYRDLKQFRQMRPFHIIVGYSYEQNL